MPVHPTTPDPYILAQTSHLRCIPFASIAESKVKRGANVPKVFGTIDIKTGNRGEPVAIETPLGWLLLGPSLAQSHTNEC